MDNKDQAYYQDLLSQYLAGTISKDDRFELEKRALDDPFLFEAIEGAHQQSENKIDAITELKEEIKSTTAKKETKRIPLFNYGIAASLILLLGVGMWFFNQANDPQDNLAMETVQQAANETEIYVADEASGQGKLQGMIDDDSESPSPQAPRTNNQYDSPKATISTKENEGHITASNTKPVGGARESTPALDLKTTSHKKKPLAKPTFANQESKPTRPKEEIVIAEEQFEPNSQLASKPPALREEEEAVFINVGAENSDQMEDSTTEVLRQELSMAREEYVDAIEKNILVAPEVGITEFKASLQEASDRFRKIVKESDDKVVIQFKITKEGQPMEFDIISGKDQDCINRIVTNLKYGVKWISSPANTEASVRLELPCY